MISRKSILGSLCKSSMLTCLISFAVLFYFATAGCSQHKALSPVEIGGWFSHETVPLFEDRQAYFEKIALNEIVNARAVISLASWGLLQDMIKSGLERLEMDQATRDEYKMAEIKLRRFVLEEIAYALRQNQLAPRIGEGTFDTIKSWVCPLYPFC